MLATLNGNGRSSQSLMPSGKSKVDRYGWTLQDKIGQLEWIDKGRLYVDHTYQRDNINDHRVLEIAQAWSWIACAILVVARRIDGSLWVVDGQHRKLAADRREDIRQLPCIIFDVADIKEEAQGYLRNNTLKSPIKTLDRFKALIVTGDPAATEISRLISDAGYKLTNAGTSTMTCNCPATLMRCLNNNRVAFLSVWPLIIKVHDRSKLSDRLVQAIVYLEAYLLKVQCGQSLLDRHNSDRLAELGLASLEREMQKASSYYSKGGARVWADGIANALNWKRKSRRLPAIMSSSGGEESTSP